MNISIHCLSAQTDGTVRTNRTNQISNGKVKTLQPPFTELGSPCCKKWNVRILICFQSKYTQRQHICSDSDMLPVYVQILICFQSNIPKDNIYVQILICFKSNIPKDNIYVRILTYLSRLLLRERRESRESECSCRVRVRERERERERVCVCVHTYVRYTKTIEFDIFSSWSSL